MPNIQVREPKYKPGKPAPIRPHHAAINRKRQEDKIKQENYVSWGVVGILLWYKIMLKLMVFNSFSWYPNHDN